MYLYVFNQDRECSDVYYGDLSTFLSRPSESYWIVPGTLRDVDVAGPLAWLDGSVHGAETTDVRERAKARQIIRNQLHRMRKSGESFEMAARWICEELSKANLLRTPDIAATGGPSADEIDTLLERHQGAMTKEDYAAAVADIRALISTAITAERERAEKAERENEKAGLAVDSRDKIITRLTEVLAAVTKERDAFHEYAFAITKTLTNLVGSGSEMFSDRIAIGTPREMFKADLAFCETRLRERWRRLFDIVNNANNRRTETNVSMAMAVKAFEAVSAENVRLRDALMDITRVPKESMKTGWLNIYPTKSTNPAHAGSIYATRELADAVAKPHRLACIAIAWEG